MKIFFENQLLHLDLHGIRHHNVEEIVQDFVLNNQTELPLMFLQEQKKLVICGNSAKMIELVNAALNKLEVNFEETRYGRIRINYLDA